MSVKRLSNIKIQYDDGNGALASNYRLFFYASGSSTKQNTYNSSAGSVANSNPIVLNALGEPAVEIWLTEGLSYKVGLAIPGTDDPPAAFVWTEDNISGVNDTATAVDEWKASLLTPTFVSATSFTLVGDQTTTFHIGRRVKTTNTAGTVYSTITNSTFGASTAVTVVNDSGVLDAGLSAVSYGLLSANNTAQPATGYDYTCQGRLTLTSGTAVTTADVTAATSVFFAPFRGNKVDLYDGTKWVRYKFAELTLAVPATTVTMYDVFLKNVSGTLTLSALAWTNDTTRATALTTQDGVNVKTGDTQSRYLGSFRTAGVAGQTEDSVAKRYVWNYFNRMLRTMSRVDTTDTWNYSTATFQQANAAAANQLDYVMGVSEEPVRAEVSGLVINSTLTFRGSVVGIGIDSTTVNSAIIYTRADVDSTHRDTTKAAYKGFPGVGRHTLVWLEKGGGADTQTWFGDNGGSGFEQSGIIGEING